MSNEMEFRVDDKVVYPAHGVGQITGEETHIVGGQEVKLYVISFLKEKMILRVPVSRAKESGLRVLSSGNEMSFAIDTLKGKAKPGRGMWSRRAQEYEGKINSGDIVAIAEVVRDLHKNVDDPDRSYSERVIYESALSRLAGEYAAVLSVNTEEATDKLTEILKGKKPANANKEVANDESGLEEELDAA